MTSCSPSSRTHRRRAPPATPSTASTNSRTSADAGPSADSRRRPRRRPAARQRVASPRRTARRPAPAVHGDALAHLERRLHALDGERRRHAHVDEADVGLAPARRTSALAVLDRPPRQGVPVVTQQPDHAVAQQREVLQVLRRRIARPSYGASDRRSGAARTGAFTATSRSRRRAEGHDMAAVPRPPDPHDESVGARARTRQLPLMFGRRTVAGYLDEQPPRRVGAPRRGHLNLVADPHSRDPGRLTASYSGVCPMSATPAELGALLVDTLRPLHVAARPRRLPGEPDLDIAVAWVTPPSHDGVARWSCLNDTARATTSRRRPKPRPTNDRVRCRCRTCSWYPYP